MKTRHFLVPALALGLMYSMIVPIALPKPASAETELTPVAHLVADINSGPTDSIEQSRAFFTELNGKAYFSANDGEHGFELWRSDGTELGTELVQDINPGPGGSGATTNQGPLHLTYADDKVFFIAEDGTHGAEPWFTTGDNTWLAADINTRGNHGSGAGGFDGHYAVLDGRVYFRAAQEFHDQRFDAHVDQWWSEYELWSVSTAGANKFDINSHMLHTDPGNPDSSVPGFPTTFKDHVYVSARSQLVPNSGTPRTEIWRTNGSGISQVANISAGHFVVAGNYMYGVGERNDESQRGLWRTSNGSSFEFIHDFGGTEIPILENMTAIGDELYFTYENSLWRSNDAGTSIIGANVLGASPNPTELTAFGDDLYFVAGTTAYGRELWRASGSEVSLVRDINEGPSDGIFLDPHGRKIAWFTELNGFLYFSANDGTFGNEMWRTNGARTERVQDINVQPSGSGTQINTGSGPRDLTRVGDQIFFSADDGVNGRELWRLVEQPGNAEGPPGHANCSDGIDNDEDGLVDLADPDCQTTPPATVVPGVPTGVKGARANKSATVSWSAATTGGDADQFTVIASPGGPWVRVDGDARTARVTGLTNGKSYTFTVFATNVAGNSARSVPSNKVIPATVPSRVTHVKPSGKKKRQMTVTWKAPAANGSKISRYQVTIKAKGKSPRTKYVSASKRKLVWKKLPKGNYEVYVIARNGVGNSTKSVIKKVKIR